MFRKILIANRGEIAVRIARACREMGIAPVAVYSDIDAAALHVQLADEAYPIGAAPSAESYLNIDRIIDAARKAGAEAIHPGYGFLSENAAFAAAVEASGLIFIGPSSESILLLGNKSSARNVARAAGAPIVPGMSSATEEFQELAGEVERMGFPVLLKAASGGGGKGMRVVERAEELEAAFRLAREEARSYFGDSSIYAERYLERPRHIEVQILGDRQGEMIHLGERECSLQRRHQKVIEECPSPLNDPDLRQRMGEVAIRIAKAAGYYSAGTVEFLVDPDKQFYFLEVNTRLQVEHPITEWVTGIDLVQSQIRIAAGEPLGFRQSDIVWRGAAMECRIYAEDPEQDFSPSPGRIAHLQLPEGPGVRVDSGIYPGWEVPLEYDPLLAKLTVWAIYRDSAIQRMQRALSEFVIDGISTPIPLFQRIMRDEAFRRGEIHTHYLSQFLSGSEPSPHSTDPGNLSEREWAAVGAVLHHLTQPGASGENHQRPRPISHWLREARRSSLREP